MFWFAIITVFMTAFYMFRAIFMTFHGEYRGGAPDEHGEHGHPGHPHESPFVMVGPLVFLSLLAIGAGWWNVTGGFNQFMGYEIHGEPQSFIQGLLHPLLTPGLPLISLLVALSGIFLAYAIYIAKWLSADSLRKLAGPLHTMLSKKYWFDEFYENVIVKIVLLKGLFAVFALFDTRVVDGTANGVANTVMTGGRVVRRLETGQLQLYGLFMGIGVLAIVLCLYFFR